LFRELTSINFNYKNMMELILQEDIKGLGRKFEIVKVRPGYAMNFLLPKSKAVVATAGKKATAEAKLAEVLIQKERIAEKAQEIKAQLQGLGKLVLQAKTASKDTLYGSVTEREIAEKIEELINVRLEKKHIRLSEALKKVGEYSVKIRLAEGVELDLIVEIQAL
jgi:large subunit ribosomal protein L9